MMRRNRPAKPKSYRQVRISMTGPAMVDASLATQEDVAELVQLLNAIAPLLPGEKPAPLADDDA
jgi:hypothetical protein